MKGKINLKYANSYIEEAIFRAIYHAPFYKAADQRGTQQILFKQDLFSGEAIQYHEDCTTLIERLFEKIKTEDSEIGYAIWNSPIREKSFLDIYYAEVQKFVDLPTNDNIFKVAIDSTAYQDKLKDRITNAQLVGFNAFDTLRIYPVVDILSIGDIEAAFPVELAEATQFRAGNRNDLLLNSISYVRADLVYNEEHVSQLVEEHQFYFQNKHAALLRYFGKSESFVPLKSGDFSQLVRNQLSPYTISNDEAVKGLIFNAGMPFASQPHHYIANMPKTATKIQQMIKNLDLQKGIMK